MSDSGQPLDQSVSKAALRARLLAGRRRLPTEQREAAARRLRLVLSRLLADLPPGGTVTAYAPFGSEPGGADLPAVLAGDLPPGGRLLLPVVLADLALDWAPYDGRLAPGTHGAAEPTGARLGRAAIREAALVVVPALAVDQRGLRLGRGGGSYDRALALTSPDTLVVALLYDDELLPQVPGEPHDQRVGAVITPDRGLVRLPAPPHH